MIRLLKEIPSKTKGLLKEIDHKVTDQEGNWDKAHQALGGSSKKKSSVGRFPQELVVGIGVIRRNERVMPIVVLVGKLDFFFGL